MNASAPHDTAQDVQKGAVLLVSALIAIAIANSGWRDIYLNSLNFPVTLGLAPLAMTKTVLHWINDGLMVIFFFLVGLEIKRELLQGALSNRKSAALPLAGALGGMVVPAAIYAAMNWQDAAALRGWAIPAATDIAFAIGVLAVLGSRIPQSLKIFLLALAIIDDLGAILIIALFYTSDLSGTALALATLGAIALALLNRGGIVRLWPYILTGLFVWLCVLKSGVHATVAGVVTALAVPLAAHDGASPLERVEHAISPWVNFGILPAFAFANAGVPLAGVGFNDMLATIPLGIAAGLFAGKPIGIYTASRLAIQWRLADMPAGLTNRQLLGAAALGGIGFTMSLFIGTLAFPGEAASVAVRIGVLTGSIISAVLGLMILWLAPRRP